MHRFRMWGVLAPLLVLGGTAAAADPDAAYTGGTDHGAAAFAKWNGGHPDVPKAPTNPQVAAARERERDTAAAVRAQEEANFLRRLAACNKLRELALQTGDDSLEQLADDLEKKAGVVYKARTSVLVAAASADSDQRTAAGKREGKR
jgi:hypothetical protein